MALADFWQITDRQNYATQEVLNVWHARALNPGLSVAGVYAAFRDSVLLSIAPQQSNVVQRGNTEVFNIGNPLFFGTFDSSSYPGLVVGDSLPPHNALGVVANRGRRDMHNGAKRIIGLIETDQANGTLLAGIRANWQTIFNVLSTPWQIAALPGVDQMRWVIIKRVCQTVGPTGDCIEYRLPQTDAELVSYDVASCTVRARVTSQVSRKLIVS